MWRPVAHCCWRWGHCHVSQVSATVHAYTCILPISSGVYCVITFSSGSLPGLQILFRQDILRQAQCMLFGAQNTADLIRRQAYNFCSLYPTSSSRARCTAPELAEQHTILWYRYSQICAGNPVFEDAAARALEELWSMRSPTGLLGGTLDMEHRQWRDPSGGIGPSSDSFYEYLLKAYILLGAMHCIS